MRISSHKKTLRAVSYLDSGSKRAGRGGGGAQQVNQATTPFARAEEEKLYPWVVWTR